MKFSWRSRALWLIPMLLAGTGLGVWVCARLLAAPQKMAPASPFAPPVSPEAVAMVLAPRLVIDQTEYSFGDLDPADPCEHVFVVRNEGSGPLHLSAGATSCRCTISHLPERPIPPGGQAAIRLASKTSQSFGYFSHTAEVLTNDPACRVLRLRISGTVRNRLAADPPRVVFPAVRSGEEASAAVTVYSQTWEAFDVASVTLSHPALRCKIGPADSETLGRLKAQSGYRIELTAPGELPGQSFWETLQITAAPRGGAEQPQVLKVDISGTTLRRVGIFAPAMDGQGVVQLGTFASGEGAKTRVMVKVRDAHRALRVRGIVTEPEFIRAELTPLNPSAEQHGLYAIQIEVPPGSPPGSYTGPGHGRVQITTDHPHAPQIEMGVGFIITGP